MNTSNLHMIKGKISGPLSQYIKFKQIFELPCMVTELLIAGTEQLAAYFFPIWLETLCPGKPLDFTYAAGESDVSLFGTH